MSNRSKENNFSYEEFVKSLAVMIFEKANGEISESICQTMAENTASRIKTGNSVENKSVEEYAEDCIWAYFQ